MKQPEIQLEIPLEWNIRKIYPMEPNLVRHPNDLIDQIIMNKCTAARKLFYIVISKDHLVDQENRHYVVSFTEIYKSKKNAKERGNEIKEEIRKAFQETSFSVSPEFVRLHLGGSASNPYLTPFALTDFISGCFHVTLTKEFKLYLHILRKYNELSFTRGDLKLLLSFNHRATDKMYWLIRREQWVRGTIEIAIPDLKNKLGYPDTINRNFCSQTLNAVRRELRGTWAEFNFKKNMKGRDIKSVTLMFDKDEALVNKLKNDLKFEYEIALLNNGLRVEYIHNIRHLIANGEKINETEYIWNPFYVLYTLGQTTRKKHNGKIKQLPNYLKEALFSGYYAEEACEAQKDCPTDYGLFGRQVTHGISIAAKAMPEHYVVEYAQTKGISLEKYIDYLQATKKIKLYRFKNYSTGQTWLLDRKYINRLKVIN